MNAPSTRKTQTFNLLSIGHRGVGKTVFLVGSYAEQSSKNGSRKSPIWFDCQDTQVQHNLNTLLEYIAKTGQYPPATMRITNFNFIAKTQRLWGEQDLCHFRWWDIPGEICNSDNPNFQKMIMESHGCCVFIDTYTLFTNGAYTRTLQGTVKQIETIASLARQSGLTYIFAIILTKCDLLAESPQKLLKIEENLRPIMARLDANQISYRRFYSTIPIVTKGKMSVLMAKGSSAPFLWLASELSKIHRHHQPQSLASGFGRILDNTAQPLTKPRWGGRLRGLSSRWSWVGIASLLVILLALLARFVIWPPSSSESAESAQQPTEEIIKDHQAALAKNPNDLKVLLQLSRIYSDLTEFDKALPLMEKVVSQQPEKAEFLFELAGLYALNGNKAKEEHVYDKILQLDPRSIVALTSKATLRNAQGDKETAQTLFTKAEEVAPTEPLKAQIRKMANDALSQPTPNPQ
ncbi:MAG: hypothetical protein HC851_04890 [Acaryochloris sp. RU_4_1]|nr:hypothetical protein [Acaryochloris sp. RU_4_1]NJN37591.1 hypothetical protein [Acaryochloridaceae cyanobacterium CSU_3_4]NJR53839.1 hypothetical protein [Acaryochloris sp. CRU_2_0]